MILIQNLTFGFGERVIIDQMNLSIKTNDKLALIGRNGVGKSTLFKLITGEILPRSGTIDIPKNYYIAHLRQDRIPMPDKTVIDVVLSSQDDIADIEERLRIVQSKLEKEVDYTSDHYMDLVEEISELTEQLGMIQPDEIKARAEQILKGLGFKQHELRRNVNTFSGGWQMRVELSKILLKSPDLLLLDEPTNYLDIESIVWFEKYLKEFSKAVIIISHDRDFLDNTTNKTLELIHGKSYLYNKSYTLAQVERQERLEKIEASFNNQQKIIDQKQRTIDRFRAQANKSRMAKSMEKQLNKIEVIEWDKQDSKRLKIQFLAPSRSAEMVVKTDALGKSYGNKVVFKDLDVEMIRGEKIALVGQNGQGKSTFVNIITDRIEQTFGEVAIGSSVFQGIFYQDQTKMLDEKDTVQESLEDGCPAELRSKLRSILGGFLFSGEDVDKKVKVLSGGEKTRLALAKLLLKPYNFLILDEPTNHLDMASKLVLQQALSDYKGTLLVISHDRFFLRGLTTKTLEMRDQKIHTYLGDIDYFLQKRNADSFRAFELQKAKEKKTIKKEKVVLNSEEEQELKDWKKKLKYCERDIEKQDQKIKEFETKMGEEGFYDREDAQKLLLSYQEMKEEVKTLNKKWEDIAEKILILED